MHSALPPNVRTRCETIAAPPSRWRTSPGPAHRRPPSHAQVIACISDEPDTGPGDNTTNDCAIVDGDSVDLRAERADNGDGRVYTIFYTVTDGSGNAAVQRCTVEVPR